MNRRMRSAQGFTLLEVLVTLTVLAVGVSLTLSLISGSLGNIRKVQSRSILVEHAQTVLDLTLLDKAIRGPGTFSGDFIDGARWTVQVEEYVPPLPENVDAQMIERSLRAKLLRYKVEVFHRGSQAPDYELQTLKLLSTAGDALPAGPAQ